MPTSQTGSGGIVPGFLPCYSLICREGGPLSFYPCYSPECPKKKQNIGHPRLVNPCTNYCCSKFLNYHDEPLASANPHHKIGKQSTFVPINNPIHPIFDKGKFRSEFDYSLLAEPLRLASLLLESPGALEYINTMAGGDISERWGHDDGKRFWKKTTWAHVDARGGSGGDSGRLWSWIRKSSRPEHLNGNARAQSIGKEILQRLSRAVTEFILSDPSENLDEGGGKTRALTTTDHRPMTARTVKVFPRGGCTTIIIARDDYMALYNLRKRQRRNNFMKVDESRHELLVQQFLLANVFAHEIGHALSVVCCGFRPPQLFHNENPMGEAGYDLEHSIYGGVMGIMDGSFKAACSSWLQRQNDCDVDLLAYHASLTISEWPSWATVGLYRETGASISVLDEQFQPPNEVSSRVPIRWLESLFSQKFWSENVPMYGRHALHPPRVASWVFTMTKDREGQVRKRACDFGDMVSRGNMSAEHRRILGEAMNVPVPAVRDDVVVTGPPDRIHQVNPNGGQFRRCCGAGQPGQSGIRELSR